MHSLRATLDAAAAGRFPPVDGGVDVLAAADGMHAAVEFAGHSFVLTDHATESVMARGADGFGGATHPDFLRWLAGPDGWIGSHDAVLVANGLGGGRLEERHDLEHHARVQRARLHRADVRVHGDETGLVTLGRGLAGRIEISVEVFGAYGIGTGRSLISQGRQLVASDELVWAQVAPGNAASLRAFLTCGFVPVCAEVLINPAGN